MWLVKRKWHLWQLPSAEPAWKWDSQRSRAEAFFSLSLGLRSALRVANFQMKKDKIKRKPLGPGYSGWYASDSIQLFRERLSYKRRKVYATMSKLIMGNGGFYTSLRTSRCFSVVKGNSTNTYSFFLVPCCWITELNRLKPQSSKAKLSLPIMPIGIVAYAFTLSWDNLCRNSCILYYYFLWINGRTDKRAARKTRLKIILYNMLVYKLWQVLVDVLSSQETFDTFVTESCGKKTVCLYRRERSMPAWW